MEHVRLHLVLANKTGASNLLAKRLEDVFIVKFCYIYNILSWKFRGVGALGRVSDSQNSIKKRLFMAKRKILIERSTPYVLCYVKPKKKTKDASVRMLYIVDIVIHIMDFYQFYSIAIVMVDT